MAIRILRQKQSPAAVVSALIQGGGISRRQAYRYLRQAQQQPQLQPAPPPKAVFTVNLPQRLIQEVRHRCRQQQRRISHVVADLLQEWLERQ
jgi:transposase-like protein